MDRSKERTPTSRRNTLAVQERLDLVYESQEYLPIGTLRILREEVLRSRAISTLTDEEFFERLSQAATIARFRQTRLNR